MEKINKVLDLMFSGSGETEPTTPAVVDVSDDMNIIFVNSEHAHILVLTVPAFLIFSHSKMIFQTPHSDYYEQASSVKLQTFLFASPPFNYYLSLIP